MGKKKEEQKKIGRPDRFINWDKLDAALQFGARLIDIQGILDLSAPTVLKAIRLKHGVSFEEYRTLKMSTMRAKLLQKQFDVAMQGNVTMLIWLGKQHLDQKEKSEVDNKINEIKINITKQEENL